MKKEYDVSQLLAGSKRIDEMKCEIERVITMVLGFCSQGELERALSDHPENQELKRYLDSEHGGWTIIVRRGHSVSRAIYCQSLTGENLNTIYSCVNGRHEYPGGLSNVKHVHRLLPIFVNGMVRTLPLLGARLQVLEDAAG